MRPINLLPPEAAKRTEARRRVGVVILLGLLYLAALGAVTVWWNGKATTAEEDLQRQVDTNGNLRQQIASLSSADDLRRRFESGVDDMQTALATDVAWGRLLNDVGRVITPRTWLTNLTANTVFDEEDPARFGQIQMQGVAFDYPDASSWLRVLDSEEWPAVGGAWVTATQLSEIGGVPVVNFTSVASLTEGATSLRLERIPEVPQ